MEALRLILLYAHLLGFAVLLGAAVAQYVAKPLRINAPMIWGAVTQLVTGIALSAPLREGDALRTRCRLLRRAPSSRVATAAMRWPPGRVEGGG